MKVCIKGCCMLSSCSACCFFTTSNSSVRGRSSHRILWFYKSMCFKLWKLLGFLFASRWGITVVLYRKQSTSMQWNQDVEFGASWLENVFRKPMGDANNVTSMCCGAYGLCWCFAKSLLNVRHFRPVVWASPAICSLITANKEFNYSSVISLILVRVMGGWSLFQVP